MCLCSIFKFTQKNFCNFVLISAQQFCGASSWMRHRKWHFCGASPTCATEMALSIFFAGAHQYFCGACFQMRHRNPYFCGASRTMRHHARQCATESSNLVAHDEIVRHKNPKLSVAHVYGCATEHYQWRTAY